MADSAANKTDDPATLDTQANPYLSLVCEDASTRSKWAGRDRQVLKRRLAERVAKRRKPYLNAPNFVVPIVDDVVRSKTDQELTMMLNAPRFAFFLSLDGQMKKRDRAKAEVAFDTFLRFTMEIGPKLDHALDTKNARGFSIVKNIRTIHPEYGTIPDIDIRDLADVIVPAKTRNIQTAERITDIYRYSIREFKDRAKGNRSWHQDNCKKVAACAKSGELNEDAVGTEIKSLFDTTKHLIGLTSNEKDREVVLHEFWHYATEWDRAKAIELFGQSAGERIIVGRKCKMIWSPQSPHDIIAIHPWRERDTEERLSPDEMMREMRMAILENREPKLTRTLVGRDRSWPYHQPRYENRSLYFHDSRGAGQLVMDDQIAASQTRNAKHVMMDYYQRPQFTGPVRNTQNMNHEPGSFLPEGVSPVQMPAVPPTFDFTTELHKREAGQRAGIVGQHIYSGQMSNKKGIQKTATEVREQSMNADMVSSASVDRFVGPWIGVFREIWMDLKRLGLELPMIRNGEHRGVMPTMLYEYKVLIVPSANAKTLNPDLQFQRAREVWGFCKTELEPMGVVFNPQEVAWDILSSWDPLAAERWLMDPEEAGEAGQPPIYLLLREITAKLEQLEAAAQSTGKLAVENSERLEKAMGARA